MNTAVISYSYTGNNEALASNIAEKLGAEHIKIKEDKKRTMGTMAFDMMLNRTPKTSPSADVIGGYDMIVLVGPIWMGGIASPLRQYIKEIKKSGKKYAFVSISGGALNDNPKVYDELVKRTKMKPESVIDMHIADLLPDDPKPTREMTSEYKVSADDVIKLTDNAIRLLGET